MFNVASVKSLADKKFIESCTALLVQLDSKLGAEVEVGAAVSDSGVFVTELGPGSIIGAELRRYNRPGYSNARFPSKFSYEAKGYVEFLVLPKSRSLCEQFRRRYRCCFTQYTFIWDIRTMTTFRTYDDLHTEDLTHIRCHPAHPRQLCTSSVDGLVNIMDNTKDREEDFISVPLSVDTSVSKFGFVRAGGVKACMSQRTFMVFSFGILQQLIVCALLMMLVHQ